MDLIKFYYCLAEEKNYFSTFMKEKEMEMVCIFFSDLHASYIHVYLNKTHTCIKGYF